AAPRVAKNFLGTLTEKLRQTTLRFQNTVHEARNRDRSLQSLYACLDLSEILTLRLDIEGLIERVVRSASQVMQADRASLFLIDRSEEHTSELQSRENLVCRLLLEKKKKKKIKHI